MLYGMSSKHAYPRDMQDALDKFNREAEQINTSFVENLKSQKPPQIIYHYTDDVGLRGILESGRLWLTDVSNLNDPSELNHGLSQAIIVLNSMVAAGPPESKMFAKQLADFAAQKGIQGSAHFFVSSFSSCGDDLGQWRAYADDGRGYALGFDTMALENEFTKGGTPATNTDSYLATFPVLYNDAELAKIDRQIIEKMLGLISLPSGRDLQNSAITSYRGDLFVRLLVQMTHAGLFFKNEAYVNEKEYRFLRMYSRDAPALDVKLRHRQDSLIRYIEFDWRSVASSALRQIVVGPAADHKKASQFAAETIQITCSAIPYRPV